MLCSDAFTTNDNLRFEIPVIFLKVNLTYI